MNRKVFRLVSFLIFFYILLNINIIFAGKQDGGLFHFIFGDHTMAAVGDTYELKTGVGSLLNDEEYKHISGSITVTSSKIILNNVTTKSPIDETMEFYVVTSRGDVRICSAQPYMKQSERYVTGNGSCAIDRSWQFVSIYGIKVRPVQVEYNTCWTIVPDEGPIIIDFDTKPGLSIASPSRSKIYSEKDGELALKIQVYDPENDTLICRYYLNGHTIPGGTKMVSKTKEYQTVSYDPLKIDDLHEGTNTLRFEVSDGVTAAVQKEISFQVDKTSPEILQPIQVLTSGNSISIYGAALDQVSGLDVKAPFYYTIGDSKSGWTHDKVFTKSQLEPNTLYKIEFKAVDAKGHESLPYNREVFTRAQLPVVDICNATSRSLELVFKDKNPEMTEYLINIPENGLFVTGEGKLSAVPTWITLKDKRITVNGLSANSPYSFKVRVRNAEGIESEVASTAAGSTLMPMLSAPENVRIQEADDAVMVSWEPVYGAVGYDIEIDGMIFDNGLETSYKHIGVLPDKAYTYRVRAKEEALSGFWSETIEKPSTDLKQDTEEVSEGVEKRLLYLQEKYGSIEDHPVAKAEAEMVKKLDKLAKEHGINGFGSAHDINYTMEIITKYEEDITRNAEKFGVPKELISSVLFREIMCLSWDDVYLDNIKEDLTHNSTIGISQNGVKRAKASIKLITNEDYTDDQVRALLNNEKDSIFLAAVYLKYVSIKSSVPLNTSSANKIQYILALYNDHPEGKWNYGKQTYEYYKLFKEYYKVLEKNPSSSN